MKRIGWVDDPDQAAAEGLSYAALLNRLAGKSHTDRGALVASARRTLSSSYLDILATEACGEALSWRELTDRVLWAYTNGGIPAARKEIRDKLEAIICAEIGNFLLLSADCADRRELGLLLLVASLDLLPIDKKSRKWRLHAVQALMLTGRDNEASKRLDKWRDVDRDNHGYLRAEMKNPFRRIHGEAETDPDFEIWWDNFNAPFKASGLAGLELMIGDSAPFDRITSHATAVQTSRNSDEPLVTVVLTSYQPSERELVTSVNSILGQTVRDFELIIVDDASGEDYQAIFERVGRMDPRIKVVHMEVNSGTYVCRNEGLRIARGTFFTGQDDDDWSHPQRFEKQLRLLHANKQTPACRVSAVRSSENLERVHLGYSSASGNASSLMAKVELLRELGGFLPARKAADNELAKRIEAYTGEEIKTIDEPLTVVRILSDSLSRSDFASGWSHPARNSFKSSYLYWHEDADRAELRLRSSSVPVSVPPRLGKSDSNTHYDVVFAADWKNESPHLDSVLYEIDVLANEGYRVGVLHLSDAAQMTRLVQNLLDPIQKRLNSGLIGEVFYDDVYDIDLLMVHGPSLLQFPPDGKSSLQSRQLIVVAHEAPVNRDGGEISYVPEMCSANAERMFGNHPKWFTRSEEIRDWLLRCSEIEIDTKIYPEVLGEGRYRTDGRVVSQLPLTVGRIGSRSKLDWPRSRALIESMYFVDEPVKVYFDGSVAPALRVLGRKDSPANWVVASENPVGEMGATEFNVGIYFGHPTAVEANRRSILETMQAGAICILPEECRDKFGDAAVYSDPELVPEVIADLSRNRELLFKTLKEADRYLQKNHTADAYKRFVSTLFTEPPHEHNISRLKQGVVE